MQELVLLTLEFQHRSTLFWAPPWVGVDLLLNICFLENEVGLNFCRVRQ